MAGARCIVIAFLVFAGWPGPVLADPSPAQTLREEIEASLRPETMDKDIQPWKNYPSRPAAELLGAELYRHYLEALEHEACGEAAALLKDGFLRLYPQLKPAFTYADVAQSWQITLFMEFYPEALFCLAKTGLLTETEKLRAQGIKIKPFAGYHPDRPRDRNFTFRDLRAWDLQILAEFNFVPAMRLYLQLEDRGDMVTIDPPTRLYLLYRLDALGAALPDQAERLLRAETAVAHNYIPRVKCWAEAGTIFQGYRNCR